MAPNLAAPAPGRVGDLFCGLGLPFRALKLVFTTPALLRLSLFCAFVTGLTLGALIYFLWRPASWIGETVVGIDGWRGVAATLVAIFSYLLMLAIGALTVPNLLLAPFQDPLSEATEAKLGNFTAPPFSFDRLVRGTLIALAHTVSRLALMVLGVLVLLPLNLIPVAGSVAYGVLSALWAMWWVAAEFLSGPMARHLLPFAAVLGAMRSRPWLAMGMGASLHVVLWVPVLNCFLVPLAVVAGTLLFRVLAPGSEDT